MVTMKPPHAYAGDQAPPPSYPVQQQAAAGKHQNKAVYWSYWGVLFGTLLTWVFSVSAAADDAWLTVDGVNFGSFDEECVVNSFYDNGKICDLFNAAKAFQILATIVVSLTLVLVIVAAFMQAPITGKLGLAAGIALLVSSLFQLIAFACVAALAEEYNEVIFDGSDEVKPGPSFGVAVVAWLLGLAGAIATLVLLKKATTDQDGPFRACMSNMQMGGANAGGTPAGAPTAVPASQPGLPVVGTV